MATKTAGSTNPREVRRDMVNSVLEGAREIIDEVIAEAKKGNYLPAKFLFEFAGIAEPFPDADDEAAARRRSLAEVLLQAVQGNTLTKTAEGGTEQPSVG